MAEKPVGRDTSVSSSAKNARNDNVVHESVPVKPTVSKSEEPADKETVTALVAEEESVQKSEDSEVVPVSEANAAPDQPEDGEHLPEVASLVPAPLEAPVHEPTQLTGIAEEEDEGQESVDPASLPLPMSPALNEEPASTFEVPREPLEPIIVIEPRGSTSSQSGLSEIQSSEGDTNSTMLVTPNASVHASELPDDLNPAGLAQIAEQENGDEALATRPVGLEHVLETVEEKTPVPETEVQSEATSVAVPTPKPLSLESKVDERTEEEVTVAPHQAAQKGQTLVINTQDDDAHGLEGIMCGTGTYSPRSANTVLASPTSASPEAGRAAYATLATLPSPNKVSPSKQTLGQASSQTKPSTVPKLVTPTPTKEPTGLEKSNKRKSLLNLASFTRKPSKSPSPSRDSSASKRPLAPPLTSQLPPATRMAAPSPQFNDPPSRSVSPPTAHGSGVRRSYLTSSSPHGAPVQANSRTSSTARRNARMSVSPTMHTMGSVYVAANNGNVEDSDEQRMAEAMFCS